MSGGKDNGRRAHTFAFTAVIGSKGCLVGRADAGVKGYREVLDEGCFDSFEDARQRANEMNASHGIPANEVSRIVTGAMR